MHLQSWHTVIAVAAISFLTALLQVPPPTWPTTAALSLACGVSAAAMTGVAALLGSRWKWIESVFGGLDRMYLTHKWLAVWALAFASFHLVFKAGIDAWTTASILAMPAPVTRLVRQLSFVSLMVIVVLALNRNIPYHQWRWWHKLSGPLFVVVILHWLSFKSPITIDSAAGLWLATTAALGIAGAAYKLVLYPFVSSHSEYRIAGVSSGGSALHLELEPVANGVRFDPGQFAFLRVKQDGLREPHPFTIASGAGPKEHVHFVIRSLGDYTQKLARDAKVGMYADVYAPFGRFRHAENARREIWIAGGVGITPFIAWLTDESATDLSKATLFYFFTPGREFPNADVLSELARRRGAKFVPMSQSVQSVEFRDRLAAIVREAGPADISVSFCGPKGLLAEIRALMREHGVPESSLRHEYFEFR
jgi:predicted ferric reductase